MSVLHVGVFVMPKGLKRYYGRGDLHFLTFSCYRRLPLLGSKRARDLFVQALRKIQERYQFLLVGYVVMPNHVHLLISESEKATPSMILKVLKQRVSHDLRRRRRRVPAGQLRLPFTKDDASLPRFWQPRFYDFNVWSKEKVREKLEYKCTPIRLPESLWITLRTGRGAVGRFMGREAQHWFRSMQCGEEK